MCFFSLNPNFFMLKWREIPSDFRLWVRRGIVQKKKTTNLLGQWLLLIVLFIFVISLCLYMRGK